MEDVCGEAECAVNRKLLHCKTQEEDKAMTRNKLTSRCVATDGETIALLK
jgi:hypothetical protein